MLGAVRNPYGYRACAFIDSSRTQDQSEEHGSWDVILKLRCLESARGITSRMPSLH